MIIIARFVCYLRYERNETLEEYEIEIEMVAWNKKWYCFDIAKYINRCRVLERCP